MIYCNDYIRLTKGYLRNMVYYQVAISNMKEDLKEMEDSLGDAKIASYEPNPGGQNELNGVESRADKAIRYKEQAKQVQKLERQVRKIERCIDKLPADQKDAVKMYYLYRQSYDEMVSSLHISHSTCRRRVNGGTKAVAMMLFGERAGEQIQFAS